MARTHNRLKSASERKPRKETLSGNTVYAYDSACRRIIKKHHEEMQHDPERLTTEFLVEITGCICKIHKTNDDTETDDDTKDTGNTGGE